MKCRCPGFRLFAVCFLCKALTFLHRDILRHSATDGILAVVSILRTLIVEVIAIVGLAYLFGINGVWMAIPVAEFVCLFVSVYMFHKNKILFDDIAKESFNQERIRENSC